MTEAEPSGKRLLDDAGLFWPGGIKYNRVISGNDYRLLSWRGHACNHVDRALAIAGQAMQIPFRGLELLVA